MILLSIFLFVWQSSWANIEDNSFLLEEAFNQEPGIHQFAQSYQFFNESGLKSYALEHEFPLGSSQHQGSYSLPYETSKGEVGDFYLNYRYQTYNKNGILHAERFSIILPTGDVEAGFGNGVVGGEFLHATSLPLRDKWVGHLNAGLNYFPEAKSMASQRRTLLSPILGVSAVYLLRDQLNILFETTFNGTQFINEIGTKRTESTLTLSPGIRFDVFPSWRKTQVVSGLAFPVEVLNSPNEHGVFLYLSIEPDFN